MTRLASTIVLIACGCTGHIDDAAACDEGMVACDGRCIAEIEPTLDALYEHVFRGCNFGGCHGARGPEAGLELSSAEMAYETLVGVAAVQRPELLRVEPFAPEQSYIIHKLRGLQMADETVQMPVGAPPLCEARIAAVEEWIREGAPPDAYRWGDAAVVDAGLARDAASVDAGTDGGSIRRDAGCPESDFGVTVVDDPDPFSLSLPLTEHLTHRATITNHGPSAVEMWVRVEYSDGVEAWAASPGTMGGCAIAGSDDWFCYFRAVPVGDTRTLELWARPPGGASATATISVETICDPIPANDRAVETTVLVP